MVGKRRQLAGGGLSRLDGFKTQEGKGEVGQCCLDGGNECDRTPLRKQRFISQYHIWVVLGESENVENITQSIQYHVV
jgi:hypothetical protein